MKITVTKGQTSINYEENSINRTVPAFVDWESKVRVIIETMVAQVIKLEEVKLFDDGKP